METPDKIITLDQMIEQINHDCDYKHKICVTANKLLIQFHQQGEKINDLYFTKILGIMRYCCVDRLTEFKNIFKYYDPPENLWRSIIFRVGSKNMYDIYDILEKRKVVFTNEFITSLFSFDTAYYLADTLDYNISLLTYLCHDSTKDTLINAFKHKLIRTANTILTMRIKADQDILQKACKFNNIDIIRTILGQNVIPNLACLEDACVVGNRDIILELLKYRIVPSNKCVKSLFNNAPKYRMTKKGIYKIHSDGRLSADDINMLLELMIADGYKLTKNDVVMSFEARIKINNLFIYGIPFDSKLMSLCHKYDFYPYDFQIEQDITCLHELCGKSHCLAQVKKIVDAGINPDQTCLEKAISSDSYLIVDYLINQCNMSISINILNNVVDTIDDPILAIITKKLIEKYSKLEENIEPKLESNKSIKKSESNNIVCYDFSKNVLPIPNIKKKIILKKLTRDALVLPNNTMASFIDLKKIVYDKIRQYKLFVNDNETIIKINKPIEDATNLPCTEFYNISDIDQIIIRLFNT
jgi:hypothetical protein